MLLGFLDGVFPEEYRAFCDQCGESFTSKRSLINHIMKVHDKSYPNGYQSPLCDGFTQHKEYHELLHEYRCNDCFTSSDSLLEMKRHFHLSSRSCSFENLVEIKGGVSCAVIKGKSSESKPSNIQIYHQAIELW